MNAQNPAFDERSELGIWWTLRIGHLMNAKNRAFDERSESGIWWTLKICHLMNAKNRAFDSLKNGHFKENVHAVP